MQLSSRLHPNLSWMKSACACPENQVHAYIVVFWPGDSSAYRIYGGPPDHPALSCTPGACCCSTTYSIYPCSFPTGSGTERWGLSGVLPHSYETDYQDRNDFRIRVLAQQVNLGWVSYLRDSEWRFTQSSLYNPSSERQIVARDLQWNNSTCNLNSIIRIMDKLNKTKINYGFARSILKFASAFLFITSYQITGFY